MNRNPTVEFATDLFLFVMLIIGAIFVMAFAVALFLGIMFLILAIIYYSGYFFGWLLELVVGPVFIYGLALPKVTGLIMILVTFVLSMKSKSEKI